jgi:hypothetical protein
MQKSIDWPIQRTPSSLILRRMSRPRQAMPRLAVRCCDRERLRAGGAASVASQQRPPVVDAGMSQGRFRGLRSGQGGAKMAFVLPIHNFALKDEEPDRGQHG